MISNQVCPLKACALCSMQVFCGTTINSKNEETKIATRLSARMTLGVDTEELVQASLRFSLTTCSPFVASRGQRERAHLTQAMQPGGEPGVHTQGRWCGSGMSIC